MRLRAGVVLAGLVTVLLPVGPAATPACAAGAPHAALVVTTGSSVLRYCVALDGPSVSGLRLIELAHDQYGVSYRSDGAAVCMLAGVGTTEGDCFGEYPRFWGYWRGSGNGGWVWAGTGAATTSVHSGQVEGWSWGSGDNGASHPRPPDSPFTSVCRPTQPPSPTPSPTRPRAGPSPTPTPVAHRTQPAATRSASPTPIPTSGTKEHPLPRRTARGAVGARSAPSPSPASLAAEPATSKEPDGGSIPGAGIVALVIAAALAVLGWVQTRRRHGRA